MRITNNIIQRNALASLQANARGLATAQQRVSTGIRIERASDDPTASSAIMGSQSSLRSVDQYRRNIDSARSYTLAEEVSLEGLTNVLDRARELATSSSSATADAGAREAALIEVRQLYQHAIQIANTQLGDRYIFGGVNADTAPVDSTGALAAGVDPVGATQPSVQIGRELRLRSTHNAGEVFIDSGVLQGLDDLSTALASGDASAIAQAGDALRDGSQAVQNLLGELGAWTNQLDVTSANLDALETNLQTIKSDLQEVDLEEAMIDLIGRQTAYQSAMLATSRVMGMTLADYLR